MKQAYNTVTGAATNAVRQSILNDYAVHAVPKLTAEWNYNRYGDPKADNIPSEDLEGHDIEYFPIESITEPLRPNKGIAKAIVGQTIVADEYSNYDEPHFYTGDELDEYKYWVSPVVTNSSGNFANHTDGQTKVRPHVMYDKPYKTNKIVVRVENTFASPNAWQVRIRSTAAATGTTTGWTTIATNPALNDADGTLTLYYNGVGWTTTKPSNHHQLHTNVAGVMLAVTSMKAGRRRDGNVTGYSKIPGAISMSGLQPTTGANSYFQLIAIEARRELDLSDRLITASDSFEMGEVSQLYPIGTLTTNTADIVLSNEDGIFNIESSPEYQGLLEGNVEFTLDYIYSGARVRQFKMYSDAWVGQREAEVSLSLEDSSKFLKVTKPRQAMWENVTVTEIIWRILDSVGFNRHDILLDSGTDFVLPVFWIDGEKTVWEILDELAKASQTAIYFDENDVLKIRRRDEAFRDTGVDWALLGQSGTRPADIVDFNQEEEIENNHFTVNYKEAKWQLDGEGRPTNSIVWEPPGDIVIRNTPLGASMTATQNSVRLAGTHGASWPYEGYLNIEGEIMRFDAKTYTYYTGVNGTVPNRIWVSGQDDKLAADKKTPPGHRHKNFFNGHLRLAERGVWNTLAEPHEVHSTRYNHYLYRNSGPGNVEYKETSNGFNQNAAQSMVTLSNPGWIRNNQDIVTCTYGLKSTYPYRYTGTKIKFTGGAQQRAGIMLRFILQGNSAGNGYYVELTPTVKLSAANRKNRNEVTVFHLKNGKWTKLSKGAQVFVPTGIDLELEVELREQGGQDRFDIMLNGRHVHTAITTDATNLKNNSGRFGIYTRGDTTAQFDYLYAHDKVKNYSSNQAFFNRVRGGYVSNNAIVNWVHQGTGRRKKKGQKKLTGPLKGTEFFDEFGAIVHEIREFDVKFDPSPALHAWVYNTNDYDVLVSDVLLDPFGGSFIISGTDRENTIVHGEDNKIRLTSGEGLQQQLMVFGRVLDIAEQEEVVAENEQAIRRNGKQEVELDSDWIQSKLMAQRVADWMKKYWGGGIDSATAEIFGNPLIQIGDVVSVDYDEKGMSPETHEYFVVGTSTSFEAGMSTTLTLRRKR